MIGALLTTKEAARYLGVKDDTLAQWRWLNIGPVYVRLGLRAVRYRQADLDAYVAKHLVTPDPRSVALYKH